MTTAGKGYPVASLDGDFCFGFGYLHLLKSGGRKKACSEPPHLRRLIRDVQAHVRGRRSQ